MANNWIFRSFQSLQTHQKIEPAFAFQPNNLNDSSRMRQTAAYTPDQTPTIYYYFLNISNNNNIKQFTRNPFIWLFWRMNFFQAKDEPTAELVSINFCLTKIPHSYINMNGKKKFAIMKAQLNFTEQSFRNIYSKQNDIVASSKWNCKQLLDLLAHRVEGNFSKSIN